MSARTIHPFPARMAPEIALDAIPEKASQTLNVLDPMCGSGTVLAVALQRGHNATGIDIDPLAVMMSQLAVTKVAAGTLHNVASRLVKGAGNSVGHAPWGDDEETEKFVDYWFARDQKRQLIALTSAVDELDDEDQKLALRLAISRIIVTKSPRASLAADTAHSRPHRVITESDYDVFSGFEGSAKQLERMLDQRTLSGKGTAVLGDARELASVPDGSADLAVTSPPYLNALDYLRGHKLALVWFGYKISELRARRSASIGAERAPGGATSEAVGEIVDVIESEATDKSLLKRPMIERFATDCIGFAEQLHRAVKPGGRAVLVVGNSTLRGNYIKNDVIARKAMEHAGFTFLEQKEREIPPTSRYMAISSKNESSSITKRMRTEVVLTLER
jgi:SAM-dependent methyltransferase